MDMQALILAAGLGTRLGALTASLPKCMLQLHGRSLISRLLDVLAALSLRQAVLVVGHGAAALRAQLGEAHCGLPIRYIYNPHYRTTNNIYSLALAAAELRADDTLLIESDLVLHQTILHSCATMDDSVVAAVAPYEPWMDGTVTALNADGFVSRLLPKGVYDPAQAHYYKTVNLYRLGRDFSEAELVPELRAHLRRAGAHGYYEEVLGALIADGRARVRAMVVDRLPWYEIDTPQDLRAAELLFASEACRAIG
jgi:choline kinase